MIYGTGSGDGLPSADFRQYNALKYAVLSGGVNHIDTGHAFRWHRSEQIVGKVLATLFEKYGLKRDEIFINSKQGTLGYNAYEQAPPELVIKELVSSTDLEVTDFIDAGNRTIPKASSLHPTFLDYSLNMSLKKLNLRTVDCAIL